MIWTDNSPDTDRFVDYLEAFIAGGGNLILLTYNIRDFSDDFAPDKSFLEETLGIVETSSSTINDYTGVNAAWRGIVNGRLEFLTPLTVHFLKLHRVSVRVG